ncbi:hypothetical protein M3J09_001214, partial [Ascochyta lentis]
MVHADDQNLDNRSPYEICTSGRAHDSCQGNNLIVRPENAQGTAVLAEPTRSRCATRHDKALLAPGADLTSESKAVSFRSAQTRSKGKEQSHAGCVTLICTEAVDEDTARSSQTLEEALFNNMIRSAEVNDARFLPKDRLKRLVTIEAVKRELELHTPSSNNMEIARVICDGRSPRRKIFAILCTISKVMEIRSFIQNNISDVDLPLVFGSHPDKKVFLRHNRGSKSKPQVPLALFASWKNNDRDSFKTTQWQFLAPYFSLRFNRTQPSRHWKLETSRILPFIEDAPPYMGVEFPTEFREGGFSFVRKIKIHPAHHNRPSNEDSSYFAVKELKKRPEQGLKEIQALLRFNDQQHDHLIRLLAMYEHRDRLNMIFPWAEGGDLDNFWKTNSPLLSQHDGLATWMSKQILGLASALRIIHHPNDVKASEGDNSKTHGRHGDIKPTNILWFRSHGSENSLGILKISDFGFAEFHAERSKSRVPGDHIQGLTDIYRAPELEVRNLVSPRYDIWSFGCVLLEFVVWYLMGHDDGISRFTESRFEDSSAVIREDNFFNFDRGQKGIITAHEKSSVNEMFEKLEDHEACTEYISDLLKVIKTHLLQLIPENRARCTVIEDKFRLLDERCVKDSAYCMPRKRLNSRRTVLKAQNRFLLLLSPETVNIDSDGITQESEAP